MRETKGIVQEEAVAKPPKRTYKQRRNFEGTYLYMQTTSYHSTGIMVTKYLYLEKPKYGSLTDTFNKGISGLV
jgi:predicted small secreted protein